MTRSSQLNSLFPSSSYHIHICGLHGDLSPGYLLLLGIIWQIQSKKHNIIVSELQGLSKTTESLTLGLEVQLEFDTRLEFWRHSIFGYQTAFRLFMQGNSWIWKINNMNILVDPVLVGNLDFGIPFLYDAAKKSKIMKEFTVIPRFFSPEALQNAR